MNKKMIVLILFFLSHSAYAQIDLSLILKTPAAFTPQDLLVSTSTYSAGYAGNLGVRIPENRILLSPKLIKLPNITLLPPAPAQIRAINPAVQATNAPLVLPLAKINDPLLKNIETPVADLIKISADEYKMIQALIFFEIRKKYDFAMSLFAELMESPVYKSRALLQYAESARALGLNSEYRHNILQLLEKTQDKALKIKTLQSVVKNIMTFHTSDMPLLNSLVESYNIEIDKNDNYHYKQAQHFITQNNLLAAERSLSQMSSKSDLYTNSVLLSASLNYRQGEVNKALAKLEKVIPLVEQNKKNPIRNLLIATLARIYFQKAQYKQAYQNYLKIDRSSPLWLQSVVEQAWAQILVGDHIGAAGNMFSLHTEIFKKAYLPESYIVRTVGYLNLCQYGDALHVLTDLDSRFERTHEKLIEFQTNNNTAMPYYDLVRAWFSQNKLSEISSLPASFVAELAVHPSFTAYQQQINNHEEENSRFSKILSDFSNHKKPAPDQQNRSEISSLVADVEWQLVQQGREGLKKMRQLALMRSENKKSQLRDQAAKAVRAHFDELTRILEKLLEQKEVLAYEIYSGAGEHIRYQVAGGKPDERLPATLTPEEKKSYKWKFRGEIWEDEIGHYRSSLKNVCANENKTLSKGDH